MENMATELGIVAPVRRKKFPWDKCGSDKCGSDEYGSDKCGTVQATNVQKTSSDDAPVTTVQATNVEAMAVDHGVDVTESRTIQTEHTTRSFKKRKVPYLKPSPPSTPPPEPDNKPKPPSAPPPAELLSKIKLKKKGKRTTACVDPKLVCR